MTKTIKSLSIVLAISIVILLGNIILHGPVEISAVLSLIGGFLIAAICYGHSIKH